MSETPKVEGTPKEPLPQAVVSARRLAQMPGEWHDDAELGPLDLGDVDFAHYQLSRWAHAAGSADKTISEKILEDLLSEKARDESDSAEPVKSREERLVRMMKDAKYGDFGTLIDPYAEQFDEAFRRTRIAEQVAALEAVQRLHRIGISNELVRTNPSPHVRALVQAIVRERPKLRIVEPES